MKKKIWYESAPVHGVFTNGVVHFPGNIFYRFNKVFELLLTGKIRYKESVMSDGTLRVTNIKKIK